MPSDRVRSGWIGGSATPGTQPSVTESEIDALDPDQYRGTLGLTADAPKNTLKPHYTKFPVADAGAWVRVVSEAKIDGIDVLIGQNWLCTVDGTAISTPKNWELTQLGAKVAQYATHANCIGELRRALDTSTGSAAARAFPTSVVRAIPFFRTTGQGIFASRVASDPIIASLLTDLYETVINEVQFDIYLSVQFQFDNSGDRSISVNLGAYYPEGNKFGLDLESATIMSHNLRASQVNNTSIPIFRPRVILPVTDPLDERPITHAIYCNAVQNSGSTLNLVFAELKVTAWK